MEPLRITVQEVIQRVQSGEPLLFVDARPQKEWDESDVCVPGALHVPPDKVEANLERIARWHPIVTYCVLPGEAASAQVARQLMEHGRENVRPLRGGLQAWRKAGYPLEPKA